MPGFAGPWGRDAVTDPSRIMEVFRAALERSGEDRIAYLDDACAGDDGLRTEVEALLRADEHADREGFLERPATMLSTWLKAAGQTWVPPSPESIGDVGPYRLLDPIGAGGMGCVYLAERRDLGNRVAVKLAWRGLVTADLRVRFEQEQRVLARLDHPGIARLLDAGATREGTPYIAMEYVDGLPITRFASEGALSTDQRVDLLLQVCDAVAYAHRNLVVHRDLKPSNILVRADGTVKLLDFGIAKLLGVPDGEPITRTGVRPMTPEYAAPEQIVSGPVTTATDVYSLGVLMFELFVGERPYDLRGLSMLETERVVCHDAVPRPSLAIARRAGAGTPGGTTGASRVRTRPGHLSADLDTIVLKALRKEPEQRYAGVAELAADLRRFRSGLPVLARPQTLAYRARRFVRRHRIAVTFAAMLAVGIPLFVGHEVRMQRETEAARAAAAAEAREARVISQFMTALYVDPFRSEVVGADSVSAIRLLDRATDALLVRDDADPGPHAVLLRHAGLIYAELGVHDRARALLDRSLEVLASMSAPPPDEVAETRSAMGFQAYFEGDRAAADSLLGPALNILGTVAPGSAAHASALWRLALVRLDLGDASIADSLLTRALSIYDAQGDLYVVDAVAARTYRTLALQALGRHDEAVSVMEQAMDAAGRRWGRRHPMTVRILDRGVRVYRKAGRPAAADTLLAEIVSINSELLGPEHPVTWAFRNAFMVSLMSTGRWAEVAELRRAYLETLQADPDAGPSTVSALRLALAIAEARAGRLDEAERTALELIEERKAAGERGLPLEEPYEVLALVREREGRLAESAAFHERVAIALGRHLPQYPWREAVAWAEAGRVYSLAGNPIEAERVFARAMERAGAIPPALEEFDAQIRVEYAEALLRFGRADEAIGLLRRAAAVYAKPEYVAPPEAARVDSLLRVAEG